MMDEKDTTNEPDIVPETDEVDREDVDVEGEEASYKDKLKALREKLKECEEEKRKNLEEIQRARADFLNSRRRLEEQLVRDRERAADSILLELLTLVDSFDTAMADSALWNTIDEKWRVGVEAIHTKLLTILRQNDVVPINPLGEKFDPTEHEAVSEVSVDDESKVDVVISVLQKGFKRNDAVLRPARVVVGARNQGTP